MADLQRSAEARWHGDLRGGNGIMSAHSGVFENVAYSFATRFENSPGTNPEELLAAAHAACYSMAFANTLAKQGHVPQEIHTTATCFLSPQPTGGFKITKMRLVTQGKVAGLDDAKFKQIAVEAEKGCPVSNALRAIDIEVDASLA